MDICTYNLVFHLDDITCEPCFQLKSNDIVILSDFKSYAVLVSRQFVDMSRIRIEGYLAAFPKLVGTGKQHTYVETENVRYVYQPIETLYLLLVTNKQSNILEDLETLRLLSKLVSSLYLPNFFLLCSENLVLNIVMFLSSSTLCFALPDLVFLVPP